MKRINLYNARLIEKVLYIAKVVEACNGHGPTAAKVLGIHPCHFSQYMTWALCSLRRRNALPPDLPHPRFNGKQQVVPPENYRGLEPLRVHLARFYLELVKRAQRHVLQKKPKALPLEKLQQTPWEDPRLTPRQRECLEAVDRDKLSYQAAGERMGLKNSVVWNYRKLAWQKLRNETELYPQQHSAVARFLGMKKGGGIVMLLKRQQEFLDRWEKQRGISSLTYPVLEVPTSPPVMAQPKCQISVVD